MRHAVVLSLVVLSCMVSIALFRQSPKRISASIGCTSPNTRGAAKEHPAAANTTTSSSKDENDGDVITFGKAMKERLDWQTFESSINARDEVAMLSFAREVFNLVISFATMEPKTPINATCQAPALLVPQQQNDTDAQDSSASLLCLPGTTNAFTGHIRSIPRRAAHAIQLGFDIDTVEILLHELIDVVDKFFIVEWTMPHNQHLNPKPLAWEAVKGQARFAFARDKIVHIIMDDVDSAYTAPGSMWSVESLQEQRRFQRIMEWNEQTKFFGADDLIGFGDADEIPSRINVHMLKHCELQNNNPVDIGIWFPMGRIDQAFQTDHPVSGHPYTLGDPTFHIWGSITSFASRNRGHSPNWILGGAHFTHYGFLPYQVLKQMSCSECGHFEVVLSRLHAVVKTGKWKEFEQEMSQLYDNWAARTIHLNQLDPDERSKIVYFPWFYNCN